MSFRSGDERAPPGSTFGAEKPSRGLQVGAIMGAMRAILFGATGMIGQAVLREALADPEVTAVLSVVRSATGAAHAKLTEVVHGDFLDFTAIADRLAGYDACLWCLGVSSAGMTEEQYRRITYDTTVAAAKVLAERNPNMTILFVTGVGTD